MKPSPSPRRTRRLSRISLAALVALLPVACGGESEAPAEETSEEAPVMDQATTDALSQLPPSIKGEAGPLRGTDLQYVEGDTETTGYLAVPEGEGPFPALVIIHEWNGLQPRVRELADDLADEGYVTLAADLFKGRTGSNRDENMALVGEVNENPDEMIANLNAAVAYLRGRDDVTGTVGAMGWCFGGGIALSYGLDGANHEATAIFYGGLVDDPERLAALSHEVYGTFGELDGGPSPEQVEAFAAALEAAGVENDLHIYDDVNHGFWLRVDQDPGVRAEAAADAWERLKAYLGRTLGS